MTVLVPLRVGAIPLLVRDVVDGALRIVVVSNNYTLPSAVGRLVVGEVDAEDARESASASESESEPELGDLRSEAELKARARARKRAQAAVHARVMAARASAPDAGQSRRLEQLGATPRRGDAADAALMTSGKTLAAKLALAAPDGVRLAPCMRAALGVRGALRPLGRVAASYAMDNEWRLVLAFEEGEALALAARLRAHGSCVLDFACRCETSEAVRASGGVFRSSTRIVRFWYFTLAHRQYLDSAQRLTAEALERAIDFSRTRRAVARALGTAC